jgi:5-methylcytosine-specific restriction endonuclease McrA
MPKPRNYTRERLNETEARKEARKARGRARYAMQKAGKVKKGDGKTVEHKKPLSKGGTNARKNLSIKSNSANSRDGGRMGNRAGKARGGRRSKR